jgi:hypothetical protein
MAPERSTIGRLADAPIASLLARLLAEEVSGTLELSVPDGSESATLVFHRGKLLKVRATPAIAYLGTVAYELGYIDATELDASLMQLAKVKQPHGQILLARRSITREQLGNALREQMLRKLTHLFTFAPTTSWSFRDGVDLLPGYGGADSVLVDPLPGIWRGVRDYPNMPDVSGFIERLGETSLRVVDRAKAERFGFQPDEYTLVECLSIKAMTVRDLTALGVVQGRTVALLLFCLAITKQLQRAEAAPAAPAHRQVGATSGTRPVFRGSQTSYAPVTAQRAMIGERAIAIANEDFFQRLALPRSATREQIDGQFAKLARSWDPSQLGPEIDDDTRHDAGRVYLALAEAHRVLADQSARETYLRKLSGVYDPAEDLAHACAKTEIDGARVCLRRNDLDRAARLAGFVLQNEPENATAVALAGWIDALRPGNDSVQATLASIAELDRAVALDVINQDALYYRSMLHSRLNNHRAALRDLQRLMEINPQHVDAVRAMRVYHMRVRSGSVSMRAVDPHPSSASGIMSRSAMPAAVAGRKR